jgi:CheY-like chemotaxis protein
MNEELLADETLSAAQMDVMHTISASTQIMVAILNDAVDLNKVERGLELEKHSFDFARLVSNVDTVYRSFLPSAVQWAVNLDPLIPRQLLGDPTRIQQMLLTLIANAMKLTSSGSITLHITRLGDDEPIGGINSGQPDVHLRFAVVDTGVGIPRSEWPLLFETVGHFEGGVLNNFTGAQGLGLRLVKALAEKMGGRIRLWSEVGVGSEFSFDAWLTRANNNAIFVFDDLAENDEPEESVSTTINAAIHPGDRFMPSSAQPHARRLFAESSRTRPGGLERVLSAAGTHSSRVPGSGASTTPMTSSRATTAMGLTWASSPDHANTTGGVAGTGDANIEEGDENARHDSDEHLIVPTSGSPGGAIDSKILGPSIGGSSSTSAATAASAAAAAVIAKAIPPLERTHSHSRSRAHSRIHSRELPHTILGTLLPPIASPSSSGVTSSADIATAVSSSGGNSGSGGDQVTQLSGIGFAGMNLGSTMSPSAAVLAATSSAVISGSSPPLSARRLGSAGANRSMNNSARGKTVVEKNTSPGTSANHIMSGNLNITTTPALAPSPATILRHLPGSVATPVAGSTSLGHSHNNNSLGLNTPVGSTRPNLLEANTPPSSVRTLARRPLSSLLPQSLPLQLNPLSSPSAGGTTNLTENSVIHESTNRGSLALLTPDTSSAAPMIRPNFRSPRGNPLTSKTIRRQLGPPTSSNSLSANNRSSPNGSSNNSDFVIPLRVGASSRTNNNNNGGGVATVGDRSDGVGHQREDSVSSVLPTGASGTAAATTVTTTTTTSSVTAGGGGATSATDSTSYLSSSSAVASSSNENLSERSQQQQQQQQRPNQMLNRAPSSMATTATVRQHGSDTKWESSSNEPHAPHHTNIAAGDAMLLNTNNNHNNNGGPTITAAWTPSGDGHVSSSSTMMNPPTVFRPPFKLHQSGTNSGSGSQSQLQQSNAALAAAAAAGSIQYPVSIPDLNLTGYITFTMNPSPLPPSPVFAANYPGSPPTQPVPPPHNFLAAAVAAINNQNNPLPPAAIAQLLNAATATPTAIPSQQHPSQSHPLHGHTIISGHSPSPVSAMYSSSMGSSSSAPMDSGRSTPGSGVAWPRPQSNLRGGSAAGSARDGSNMDTPTPPWVVFRQPTNTSSSSASNRYESPRPIGLPPPMIGSLTTSSIAPSATLTSTTMHHKSSATINDGSSGFHVSIPVSGLPASGSGIAPHISLRAPPASTSPTPLSAAAAAQLRLLAAASGNNMVAGGGSGSGGGDISSMSGPISPPTPIAPGTTPLTNTHTSGPAFGSNNFLQVNQSSFNGVGQLSLFSPTPPHLHLNLPPTPGTAITNPHTTTNANHMNTSNNGASTAHSSSSTPGSGTLSHISSGASTHHARFAPGPDGMLSPASLGGLSSPDTASPPHPNQAGVAAPLISIPLPIPPVVVSMPTSGHAGQAPLSSLLSPVTGSGHNDIIYALSPPGPSATSRLHAHHTPHTAHQLQPPASAGGGTLGPVSGGRALTASQSTGALASSGSSGSSTKVGQKHVLLVEDNIVNQKSTQRTLERLGVTVTTANDGIEAVDLSSKIIFDLILMDLNMPRMGGIDATKRIRSFTTPNGRVPIVAVTAQALDQPQCMAAGMDGFMIKPLTMVALRELIVRHTGADLGSEQPRPVSRAQGTARSKHQLPRSKAVSAPTATLPITPSMQTIPPTLTSNTTEMVTPTPTTVASTPSLPVPIQAPK